MSSIPVTPVRIGLRKQVVKPRAHLLAEVKLRSFNSMKLISGFSSNILLYKKKWDECEEEFTNATLYEAEDWLEDWKTQEEARHFASKLFPVDAKSANLYENSPNFHVKTAEGFNWFVFWDEEDEAELTEMFNDYVHAHEQIRAAGYMFNDGGAMPNKENYAPGLEANKKRKLEASQETDTGLFDMDSDQDD